jgi:hypothetical protein
LAAIMRGYQNTNRKWILLLWFDSHLSDTTVVNNKI